MASGFRNSAGQDFDVLFAPDTVGDGPTAPGFRKSDGTLLKYANISHGTRGPDTGFRLSNGQDVASLWAQSGSAQYSLPINGNNYTSNNQLRGHAEIRFYIRANGTYEVRDWRSDSVSTVLASGSWLTDGSSNSLWTVDFDCSISNVATVDGGTCGVNNTADSQTPCTSDQYAGGYAQANLTTDRATCNSTMVCRLYKSGVLKSTTTIYGFNNVNGN